MYRKPACSFAVVAVACCVLGCVTLKRHPYEIEPGYEGAPGVQSIALLPLNLVLALPGELEYAQRRVDRQIARYLKDTGLEVSIVRLHEARSLLASVVESGASEQEGATARRFVARLREDRSFDAVVLPSLVYREAKVRAVTHDVVWDGVTRKLSILDENQRELSLYYTADVAGRMPAVSLEILVYDAEGARIFESYGGLDLVHEANISTPGQALSYEWRLKRERLNNEDAIREGVAVAFDPYLPIHSVESREAP